MAGPLLLIPSLLPMASSHPEYNSATVWVFLLPGLTVHQPMRMKEAESTNGFRWPMSSNGKVVMTYWGKLWGDGETDHLYLG